MMHGQTKIKRLFYLCSIHWLVFRHSLRSKER